MAETGAALTSIDLSVELIGEANKQPHTNIAYCVGDIERVSFADSVFDAVVGSSILHHVDTEQVLREAFRVLKPGGSVAFAEPNMLNPQIALQKNIPLIKRWLGDSPDETAFIRWKVRRMLAGVGFVDVYADPYDFLHPLVPPVFIPFVQFVGDVLESTPVVREFAGSIIMWGRKPASQAT